MTKNFRARIDAFCWSKMRVLAFMVVATTFASPAAISPAQPPSVGLTKVGSPIWRPVDFQMFTAPANPFPDAFNHTIDLLLPVEGPGAATYTPHAPPYNTELSTNAAAAGFVQQSVFPLDAITFNPNAVWFVMMWVPDPGVTGSSRDFASGPVIPNSLFPFTTHSEMWLNGAKVETLQDGPVNVRPGDMGFTGASHRAPGQAVWYPWADDPNAGPAGNYELRWSLRDNQGNGWDIAAPFRVVPEPTGVGLTLAAMVVCAVVRRKAPTRRSAYR
jgi:hypothetical protein